MTPRTRSPHDRSPTSSSAAGILARRRHRRLPKRPCRAGPLLDLLPAERRDLYRDLFAEVLATGASRVLAPGVPPLPDRLRPAHAVGAFRPDAAARDDRAAAGRRRASSGLIVTIEDVTERLDEDRSGGATRRSAPTTTTPLAAVGANDWRLRGAAVRVLRQSASREEIAHLLESLQRDHHDLNLLSSALQVLIAADRDVVTPLIALLSDREPEPADARGAGARPAAGRRGAAGADHRAR